LQLIAEEHVAHPIAQLAHVNIVGFKYFPAGQIQTPLTKLTPGKHELHVVAEIHDTQP
jgi:hypothetical protein